jgi:hypothetical protein
MHFWFRKTTTYRVFTLGHLTEIGIYTTNFVVLGMGSNKILAGKWVETPPTLHAPLVQSLPHT